MQVEDRQRWALVLAAGAGTRLNGLTRFGNGSAVPKQFCSLTGGASLLEDTLERAFAITEPARTIAVVAAEHRRFWADGLATLPAANLIVQPSNRGTAFGIMLGIAAVLARDPEALVLVLPSDHFVAQEGVLRQAILRAFAGLDADSAVVRFLGIRPETADPELGYIVRGTLAPDGSYRIAQFVEKPSRAHAQALITSSALWNSFILVGRARAFVDMIAAQYPVETAALLRAARRLRAGGWGAHGLAAVSLGADSPDAESLDTLYARLPSVDFSRDIVQRSRTPLEVVPVGACGWSDLGTPERVADCLMRVNGTRPSRPTTHLSLAEAHVRYAQASA